tara:strand:+ start:411 stop:641 length:231 start_codon:yes stop_codon:yes gene_type:complete
VKEIQIDGKDYYLIPKAQRLFNAGRTLRITRVMPDYQLNSSALFIGLQHPRVDRIPEQKFNVNDHLQIINLTKGET